MSTVSPTVKFCRWAFLITGIVYGSSHHSTLKKREESARRTKEAQEAKKQSKAAEAAPVQGGEELDPSSPKFDLEKVLLQLEKQEAKN